MGGKEVRELGVWNYDFRLLTKDKSSVLVKGGYLKVMKRFWQIEFF